MYGIVEASQSVIDGLTHIQNCIGQSPICETDLLEIDRLVEKAQMLRDKTYKTFEANFNWAQGGYRSGVCAIETITGHQSGQIRSSIAREEVLAEFPKLKALVDSSAITLDHVNCIASLKRDKIYSEYLADNISSLQENAPEVNANQFALLVRHWKYAIDNYCREGMSDYDRYCQRELSLYQMPYGDWIIEGTLDQTTGTILNKALEDITNKIWHASGKEQRGEFEIGQARADALGYLAKGYITNEQTVQVQDSPELQDSSYAPPLTTDVVIDVIQIKTDKSVNEFIRTCAKKKNALTRAHSKKYLEQLLCDTKVSVPIKTVDNKYDLGRSVRTAPTSMKRTLALESHQCSINGCSVPAKWCDAHHIHHWINGGETKIENLVLLCRRHHTQIHNDPIFEHKISVAKELINTS